MPTLTNGMTYGEDLQGEAHVTCTMAPSEASTNTAALTVCSEHRARRSDDQAVGIDNTRGWDRVSEGGLI